MSAGRSLPLAALHASHGARFECVAGWNVPRAYGDAVAEYHAAHTSVGITDLSHMGRLRVAGAGRTALLDALLASDVRRLRPGDALAACLLHADGRLRADLSVYERGDDLLCLLRPEGHPALVAALAERAADADVVWQDVTSARVLLSVMGARHAGVLRAVLSDFDAEAGCSRCRWQGEEIGVLAYPPEASQDHLLEMTPAAGAALVATLLAAHGARLVGRAAQEMMRVESGRPLLGTDVGEDAFPFEARLEHAIDLGGTHHHGVAALAEAARQKPDRRRVVGLRSDDVLAVGASVRDRHGPIAQVTSAVRSPRLAAGLALALLERAPAPDAALTVDDVAVAIVPLPLADAG